MDFVKGFDALVGTNFESLAIDIPGTLVERIGVLVLLAPAGADFLNGARDPWPVVRLVGRGFRENVIGTNCNT